MIPSRRVIPLKRTFRLLLFQPLPENVFHDLGVRLAERATEVTGLRLLLLDSLFVFEQFFACGRGVAESVLHDCQVGGCYNNLRMKFICR